MKLELDRWADDGGPCPEDEAWQRNYAWNLAALRKPGALDPAWPGRAEDLARDYANADTGEGIKR